MQGLMLDHGWAIQYVEGDRLRPGFAYTVGLSSRELPELLVTGLSPDQSAALLNTVADYVPREAVLAPGERVELAPRPGVPCSLRVVEVSEPGAHLLSAVEFFGEGVRALQLVYQDERGRWPWQPGFRGRRGGQPVLGIRADPDGAAD